MIPIVDTLTVGVNHHSLYSNFWEWDPISILIWSSYFWAISDDCKTFSFLSPLSAMKTVLNVCKQEKWDYANHLLQILNLKKNFMIPYFIALVGQLQPGLLRRQMVSSLSDRRSSLCLNCWTINYINHHHVSLIFLQKSLTTTLSCASNLKFSHLIL